MTVESGVFTGKIGDEYAELSVVQIVADGHPHGTQGNAILVDRHAGWQTDF